MSESVDLAQKFAYVYVTFTYGDPGSPTVKKYTNWLTPADGSFTPEPTLEVKAAENTGALEDKTAQIALPLGDAFTTYLSTGDVVEPVFVTIQEVIVDPLGVAANQTLMLFKGRVSTVRKHAQGKGRTLLLEAVSVKGQLRVPLGIVADVQCYWTLFGPGCQVTPPTFHTGTLTTINNDRTVVITGIPSPPGGDATYYRRGSINRLGLSIVVRDWDGGNPEVYRLVDRAPAAWLGQTVTVVPGCDKTIGVCRNRWSNEINFGGFGFGIPAYHPVMEG